MKKQFCLGVGYVSVDGKAGKYSYGYWANIGLSAVKEGHQTCYNMICLNIPDSLDPNKKYVLTLEEAE